MTFDLDELNKLNSCRDNCRDIIFSRSFGLETDVQVESTGGLKMTRFCVYAGFRMTSLTHTTETSVVLGLDNPKLAVL